MGSVCFLSTLITSTLITLIALLSPVAVAASEIVIGVGTHAIVQAKGNGPITVSNGKVVRAEDLGSSIRLTGRRPGASVVTTQSASHLITVLSANSFHAYKTLQNLFADMRGLELSVDDGTVVVRGRLLRSSDWKKIAITLGAGAQYVFRADLDPLIRDEVESEFQRLLRESGLPPLEIQFSPATVRLAAERSDLAKRAAAVFSPYGFTVEKAVGALTLEPLVRVQILVTEVRKRVSRTFGVKWPDFAQAQILPILSLPGSAARPLSVELQALEARGDARILASPNLLCRSGKEAQFLAGGEYPIKISTSRRQEVVWKRYGVLLKIKPLADVSGRMSIALETEVSSIDPDRSVDGLPALMTNRIESHFDLRHSRTIALSGLIRRDSNSSSSGLPGLGSLPILGPLFASKDFRDQKTELIVFVTPEVLPPETEP